MRILLVEDEKKMSEFIRKGLLEAGYAVDLAETSASAQSLCKENNYELIILDVMLPDQTGFDTARKLRGEGKSMPILMLTALSGTKDKVNGLDAGADDYLSKPFAFEELLARVRALLRRQIPQTQVSLKFADIEMDLISRKVKRGNTEITLTQKEFALLEYLMRNSNRPVSRTSISEHVWDMNFDSESNVIDVYVNMLRKKLNIEGHNKKIIHTVVGVGYVLKEE